MTDFLNILLVDSRSFHNGGNRSSRSTINPAMIDCRSAHPSFTLHLRAFDRIMNSGNLQFGIESYSMGFFHIFFRGSVDDIVILYVSDIL